MKIDLYCNDGSPLGVIPEDIYGRGVGGAELAMMSWAETMALRSHQVRIYNSPRQVGTYQGVEYLPQGLFNPVEKRDVFIAFRSPNPFLKMVKADYKIHWSCDPYTVGNFGRDILPYVDKVICISPFHCSYYRQHYGGGDKVTYLDLGVRLKDYDQEIGKVAGRCIFCSVPSRGLMELSVMWPRIKERVPGASLVITSDYTLWGGSDPGNGQFKSVWSRQPDVEFVGNIPRKQLVKEQLRAVCHPYPCNYEELFCISVAETQVAKCIPVTTQIGAMATTSMSPYMFREADGSFIESVTNVLNQPIGKKYAFHSAAEKRFNWWYICEKWERLICGNIS